MTLPGSASARPIAGMMSVTRLSQNSSIGVSISPRPCISSISMTITSDRLVESR